LNRADRLRAQEIRRELSSGLVLSVYFNSAAEVFAIQ
jgi:hypothetical protein